MMSNQSPMFVATIISSCLWLAGCGGGEIGDESAQDSPVATAQGAADWRAPDAGGQASAMAWDAASLEAASLTSDTSADGATATVGGEAGSHPSGSTAMADDQSLTLATRGRVAARPLTALLPGGKAVGSTAPLDADVIFSPRFDRPEAVSVATAYGATRIEWSFTTDKSLITALRSAVGGRFGGTINNNAVTTANAGAAIDFDGRPIVAPWMASWGALWNSCAAPESTQALKHWVDTVLASGATSIQFDDPGMQFDSSFWGVGDLSPVNLRLFRAWVERQKATGVQLPVTPEQAGDYRNWLRTQYGVTSNADYVARSTTFPSTVTWRAFLKDTVTQCLTDIRSYVKSASNNQATLSMNIYTPLPWASNAFLPLYSDFVVGEMAADHSEYHHLLFISQWLRMDGKRWAPVYPLTDKKLLRTRIASTYAVGGNPVIPWDMFIQGTPTTPTTRYFGSPADYADLYKFVRQNAGLLNGWETLSRLNLVVYGDPSNITESFAQLKRLADLQVPYVPYVRKDGALLTGLRTQTNVNKTMRLVPSKSTYPDQQTLVGAMNDASLTPLAAASGVTPGLQVIVKANVAVPGNRVVHVLRKSGAGTVGGLASMTLSDWTLGSATSFTARVLSPTGVIANLGTVTRRSNSGLTLSIPAPAEWSLVELTPVSAAR